MNQETFGRRTYVLYTMSGNEKKVLDPVKKYVILPGEDVYCLTSERVKRIRGKDVLVKGNLYPGYLFVTTFDSRDFFLRLRESLGRAVFEYIAMQRTDEYLLPVSDAEEEMIRQLGGEKHICGMSRGIIEGNSVIITDGPLKDFEGEIKKINRHKKTALISISLLGRKTDALVGLEIIKKV